jgi:uncharacterized SAM-binding protein YcdF (DUF218 family)
MFYFISKLGWLFASPLHLSLICLSLGLLLAWRGVSAGLKLANCAALALLIFAFSPIGAALMRPLEDRFPTLPLAMEPPTGIIVLGGALDQSTSLARQQTTLDDAADRLTAGAVLARLYPKARLIFSGGSAAIDQPEQSEAAGVHRFWLELGVPEGQMSFENRSRNTYENAMFTRDLFHPQPQERWLLVTSAFHMPRSVGIFRAAGMNVIAYPVDYRTQGNMRDFVPFDAARAINNVETAVREYIGLVAYRLAGKSAALFPAP